MIKEKKQAAAQCDLDLQKLEHDVQVLEKEKTMANNMMANLEKAHEWIAGDKECVSLPLPSHSPLPTSKKEKTPFLVSLNALINLFHGF